MAKKSANDGPRAPRRRATPRVDETTGATAVAMPETEGETGAPAEEDIARRAYQIYRARGGQDGYDMDDWLQAERELREARGRG